MSRLPELERALIDAAGRLDGAQPRRRWWRHGWAILGLVLAATGTSVAVARVAHVGPFAYLDSYTNLLPKRAPTSVVTVEPSGDAPAWQARALIDGIGQLCITGGPRDPRPNPTTRPTSPADNPPQAGMTCADSDEVAQAIVDPAWPGASFGGSSYLVGSQSGASHVNAQGRRVYTAPPPPTRVLVYAVTSASAPNPVVRWAAAPDQAIPMQASKEHLRLTVDKDPAGLSPAERRMVARYPDVLDLVLWAADVAVPSGVSSPQVAFPAELPPHGVDDATIEMIGSSDFKRLDALKKRTGWKYVRHISREPAPVKGSSRVQRRWIAAFARPRTAADAVPKRLHNAFQREYSRVQYAAGRRLTIVGGGVKQAWIVPGGFPESSLAPQGEDQFCLLGAPLLGQCKNGAQRWKQPLVEAVSCAGSLNASHETLVWALTPPGATRVEVTGPGARVERLPAGELVAVRRAVGNRIASITWTLASGARTTVRVPWPRGATPKCGSKSPAWSSLRQDSAGSSAMGGGPRRPGVPPTLR
jgi:hypothetical protein